MASSIDNNRSRYVWGGSTTVFPNRLGWWERRDLPKDDNDITLTISSAYERRPDLLAFDLYGDAKLQTLILQYNNILDPTVEFVAGLQIQVPELPRVIMDILNQPTGGVPEK